MTESCSEKGRMTVFYDGACPLCSREIAFYRKLRGAEAIEWFDVSAVLEDKVAVDLPKQTACERFHVRGADGQLFAGGRAFVHLWTALPAVKRIGDLLQRQPFLWITERTYDAFLRLRPVLQLILKKR
jgi:predicted DCC family thiol-disulfide oxidoreductase YuxK